MTKGRPTHITRKVCPDCGKKVKVIVSMNGSHMAVELTPMALWIYDDASGLHIMKLGYRTHNYTCIKRMKYRAK